MFFTCSSTFSRISSSISCLFSSPVATVAISLPSSKVLITSSLSSSTSFIFCLSWVSSRTERSKESTSYLRRFSLRFQSSWRSLICSSYSCIIYSHSCLSSSVPCYRWASTPPRMNSKYSTNSFQNSSITFSGYWLLSTGFNMRMNDRSSLERSLIS